MMSFMVLRDPLYSSLGLTVSFPQLISTVLDNIILYFVLRKDTMLCVFVCYFSTKYIYEDTVYIFSGSGSG